MPSTQRRRSATHKLHYLMLGMSLAAITVQPAWGAHAETTPLVQHSKQVLDVPPKLSSMVASWAADVLQQARNHTLFVCNAQLPWLAEYQSWHAQTIRQKPSTANVLLFICGYGVIPTKDFPGTNCFGLGDRVRGMEEAVRLAVGLKRVLLIGWSSPMALEHFFEPPEGGIDWRVKPEYGLKNLSSHNILAATGVWYRGERDPPMRLPSYLTPGNESSARSTRLVAFETNVVDTRPPQVLAGPPVLGYEDSPARACVFNTLFTPTPQLRQRIRDARRELLGSDTQPYVAVHLRLGGMPTEMGAQNRLGNKGDLQGLLTVLTCARTLAAAHNITAPILVLTDNSLLRSQIASGYFTGVVGPKEGAVHITNEGSRNVTTHMTTFVDVGLLAQATCLITSKSGFSYTAQNWGNHRCAMSAEACATSYAKHFEAAVSGNGHRQLMGVLAGLASMADMLRDSYKQ